MGRKLNVYGYKIGDYGAWAGWARKLLGERDMTRAISTGNVRRGFESHAQMAARQVAEARAARAVIEPQEQPQDDPQEALRVPGESQRQVAGEIPGTS